MKEEEEEGKDERRKLVVMRKGVAPSHGSETPPATSISTSSSAVSLSPPHGTAATTTISMSGLTSTVGTGMLLPSSLAMPPPPPVTAMPKKPTLVTSKTLAAAPANANSKINALAPLKTTTSHTLWTPTQQQQQPQSVIYNNNNNNNGTVAAQATNNNFQQQQQQPQQQINGTSNNNKTTSLTSGAVPNPFLSHNNTVARLVGGGGGMGMGHSSHHHHHSAASPATNPIAALTQNAAAAGAIVVRPPFALATTNKPMSAPSPLAPPPPAPSNQILPIFNTNTTAAPSNLLPAQPTPSTNPTSPSSSAPSHHFPFQHHINSSAPAPTTPTTTINNNNFTHQQPKLPSLSVHTNNHNNNNNITETTTIVTGGGLNQRRQKRLERNRESARLSRRRRKQYLEVLEERVNSLSFQMDQGRRQHVLQAIPTLRQYRQNIILPQHQQNYNTGNPYNTADCPSNHFVRAGSELRLAYTFTTLQIWSLALPPLVKFILWLTLQNDAYFRGGRAASERLSAARIGERMLASGSDKVSPSNGMWPLFCNEIGLSYDQEERVRSFQNRLLQSPEVWLQRHTATATLSTTRAAHDTYQSLCSATDQREKNIFAILKGNQKRDFLAWAIKNKERIAKKFESRDKDKANDQMDDYTLSKDNHESANLYILRHRLVKASEALAKTRPLVAGSLLKKLSRRPLFESLVSTMAQQQQQQQQQHMDTGKDDGGGFLSGERSFPSTGSLKRSLSELSVDEEENRHNSPHETTNITPEGAEKAVSPAIEKVLGFIKEIIPKPAPLVLVPPGNSVHFSPTLTSATTMQQQQQRVRGMTLNNHNGTSATSMPSPVLSGSTQNNALRVQQQQQQTQAPLSRPMQPTAQQQQQPSYMLDNVVPGPEIPLPAPVFGTTSTAAPGTFVSVASQPQQQQQQQHSRVPLNISQTGNYACPPSSQQIQQYQHQPLQQPQPLHRPMPLQQPMTLSIQPLAATTNTIPTTTTTITNPLSAPVTQQQQQQQLPPQQQQQQAPQMPQIAQPLQQQHVIMAPAPPPVSRPLAIPAFLPPHLNVVPEEGCLPGNGTVDFLFELTEEEWAIGEGFEMDTTAT